MPEREIPVDLAALAAWMTARGLGRGPIGGAQLLAGGTQNILLRFERDGTFYVLRRPPLHLRAHSNETMRREMRMLAALAGTDVPHPRLIAACPDETVLGAAFYLMTPVAGFNATTGLPALHAGDPALRRRMGLSLVEGIARLGAVDHHAAGLGDFGRPEGYLERQVARWRGQLDSYGEYPGWAGPAALPGVARIADWLDRHRPPLFTPGIIHGDYHLANVMFEHGGPELAAIVDWELTTIGDPLIDLGWLIATWPDEAGTAVAGLGVTPWTGFPAATDLVTHYRSLSARDLSHVDWYAVLACYKLGIILEGTNARAGAGKAPKATGDLLHAAAVALFERAAGWIS
ncbi:phosphotransferase family protein [Zavarzinia compransoris]|uniref:Phosphotransferase family protein n=1 Tax=Zavarzinia compransoris TaxID=1264899 RepID=A0A317DWY7_9PROT|nr:phosphotransferase family protein [Zavarzinia compransoris]PWR18874.1 phosphotransferase family protein [Zavarzinia compransoris]TDP48869.1 aminoglycoside phosphotransferase (APT) family kinase protein [Zavarzinia compransoris]